MKRIILFSSLLAVLYAGALAWASGGVSGTNPTETGSATTPSSVTTASVDAGVLIIPSATNATYTSPTKKLCLNGTTCSDWIMSINNSGASYGVFLYSQSGPMYVSATTAEFSGNILSSGRNTASYFTTTGAPSPVSGSVPVTIGSRSVSFAAIWLGTAPANTTVSNYTLLSDGILDTYLQGVNNIYFVTTAGIAGQFDQTGNLAVLGKVSSTNGTSCTLNGGTPSTCTATVTAGAKCQCTNVGTSALIASGGCDVNLVSTTLTVTSATAATNVVNILCDK